MKTLLIIISAAFIIPLATKAQQEIGLKLNGGVSYIDIKSLEFNFTTQENYLQPSWQGGLFYNTAQKHHFSFGLELLFVQINGKEYNAYHATNNNGSPNGNYNTFTKWRYISYIGIPIFLYYSINKFTIKLGYQSNRLLFGKEKGTGLSYENGNPRFEHYEHNHVSIDKFDYGIKAGILYKIKNNFIIEADYYYGTNNIFPDPNHSKYNIWQVQQLTLGLRYNLYSFNIEKQKNKLKIHLIEKAN